MTDLVKIQREGQGDGNKAALLCNSFLIHYATVSFIGLVHSNYTSKTDLENVVTY